MAASIQQQDCDLLLQAAAQFRVAKDIVWTLKDKIASLSVRARRAARNNKTTTMCLLTSQISVYSAVSSLYETYANEKAELVTALERREWDRLADDIENMLREELEGELNELFD